MTSIPTAEEARATVDNATSQKAIEEWEQLAAQITQAIGRELTSITVSDLTHGNRKKLESMGYTVTSGGRYNEVEYSISW